MQGDQVGEKVKVGGFCKMTRLISVISSLEGAMSGGFNFQVTDGLNFAPRQIFSITARALIISLEVNRGLSIFPGKILTSLSV